MQMLIAAKAKEKQMSNSTDIQQQLASLRLEFASSLVQRVEQLIEDLNSLSTQQNPVIAFQEVFRQIHSLSGSAGTFGFNKLSEQFRQLELILKENFNQQTLPDAKTTDFLNQSLQKLFELIAKGPDEKSSSELQVNAIPATKTTQKLVYLVEDEIVQAKKLCLQLDHHGYKTRYFTGATQAREALVEEKPDALVLDIVLPEGYLAGTELADNIRQLLNESVPAIFISSQKDWQSRLAAVRAGGIAYLDKPVDVAMLVDLLDRCTQRIRREPYRVLVVDDALELAQHYSLVLRQAGMHAGFLTEPAELLEKLENFKPELILLDVYFPDISGAEIAQVLHQHQNYFSIPIIFLSAETDRDIQLQTLQQGDNFLEKPILDNHLVSTVASRIERARALNKLMYHDGLTGLLNHITLKRRLEVELVRSQRQAKPLSYIILDLDHFKQVNDANGHMAGDRVLKSLAQLLTQRLRKSDQIGRYGGEEFAIIMPDTDVALAHQIIDDLRKAFAELSYQSESGEFSCSFSAGISCTSAFAQQEELIEAADKALYQAKASGRNQTILHHECKP